MNKIRIKTFVQKTIDNYLEKRQHLCKDFNSRKIEKIKNQDKHPEIIKNLMQREIGNLYPKHKIKIKEYGLYIDLRKFVKEIVKPIKKSYVESP